MEELVHAVERVGVCGAGWRCDLGDHLFGDNPLAAVDGGYAVEYFAIELEDLVVSVR